MVQEMVQKNSPKNGPKNSPIVQRSIGPVHILTYASKYFIFLDCNLPNYRLREVNYNKISHLGSPKGDRVRLKEVTV